MFRLKGRLTGRATSGRRRRVPIVAVVMAASCCLLAGAGVAIVPTADDDPHPPYQWISPYTVRWVTVEGEKDNLVDWDDSIGTCVVYDKDSSCGMSQTSYRSYTISADFGVSAATLSATLGVMETDTVSIGIRCDIDQPPPPGYGYKAYPMYKRHYFHVMELSGPSAFYGYPSNPSYVPPTYPDRTTRYPSAYVDIPNRNVACKIAPL